MRFRIEHPAHPDAYATYGHDPHLGFFVEVVGKHGRQLDYDATYKDYCGLKGALVFLSKAGFFAIEDLHEALVRVEHEPEERLPAGLRRISSVAWNFKNAADPENA
jgi:hypothetical protein